jgi:hypothetical protein
MGCSCGNAQPASYIEGENYGIYGYLPTAMEYTPTDVLTAAAVIGGMAFVAFLAVSSGEKKRKSTNAEKALRRKLGW